ncbi:hypothetical protein GOV08_00810 [Candidatus Woesearchaeota archaeon]|nr:hypothetical protein [Candidatus Woesearchaeota archaeon]
MIIIEQFKAAPLSSSFMLASMLGFFISVFYIYRFSPKFGATFTLIFILMFLAAFISMSKAPVDDEAYLADLAIHEPTKHIRSRRK